MGRHPKAVQGDKLKKGGWSEEEDAKLKNVLENGGADGLNWETISEKAGLNRCGKSCRLRWKNYLSPDILKGDFSDHEEETIILLQSRLGNKYIIFCFLYNRLMPCIYVHAPSIPTLVRSILLFYTSYTLNEWAKY